MTPDSIVHIPYNILNNIPHNAAKPMNNTKNVMLGWLMNQPKARSLKETGVSSTLCSLTGALM